MENLLIGIAVLLLVGIIGFLGFVVSLYNSLIQVKNNIAKAWSNIEVLLLQRHDELPKLIEVVKGYLTHEREVLVAITKMRLGYGQAQTIDEKSKIENKLNREMARLQVTVEQYPELKADKSFRQLQHRISALESSVADRREFFNDCVNIYNIQIERFPEVILARLLNYHRHDYLEIPRQLKQDFRVSI